MPRPPTATIRLVLAGMVALVPAATRAEVLNYDYVYLSKEGAASGQQADNGNGTAGGFKSFAQHTHVFLSYDDTAFYAGSNADWDYDLKTWRVGAGGHYLIGKRTMIAPSFAVFRSRGEVMAPSWTAPRGLSGTGTILEVDLRHAVTRWLELTVGARRTRFEDGAWTELVGGVLFHPNDTWAVGALHHDRDGEQSTELTLRYYY